MSHCVFCVTGCCESHRSGPSTLGNHGIVAPSYDQWKSRALAAEARVKELERLYAIMMETHQGECPGCVEWENSRGRYHGADCEFKP